MDSRVWRRRNRSASSRRALTEVENGTNRSQSHLSRVRGAEKVAKCRQGLGLKLAQSSFEFMYMLRSIRLDQAPELFPCHPAANSAIGNVSTARRFDLACTECQGERSSFGPDRQFRGDKGIGHDFSYGEGCCPFPGETVEVDRAEPQKVQRYVVNRHPGRSRGAFERTQPDIPGRKHGPGPEICGQIPAVPARSEVRGGFPMLLRNFGG